MNKDFHLVINPGRYPRFSKQMKKMMRYTQGATISESSSREDFIEKIKAFLNSEASYLLIWGGDGTANLALNTIMNEASEDRRRSIAIGFLRGGSGNGIQDSYEVPRTLMGQVKCYLNSMKQELTQEVNLLKVSYDDKLCFGQLFGSGLDARILESRNRNKRSGGDKAPHPGFIPYLIPAITTIWNHARLTVDSQTLIMKKGRFAFRGIRTNAEFPFKEYTVETRASLIELGVRPYFGWYYKICPDVVCNDDRFSTYLFNVTNPLMVLFHLFHLWNGQYQRINNWNAKRGLPLIEHYKISEITLKAKKDRRFHIDGEMKKSDGDIHVSIEKAALRFLVPRSFHEKFHPIHNMSDYNDLD